MSLSRFVFQTFVSLFVVSFGLGSWIPYLGLVAGAAGYAIFWDAMLRFSSQRHRFWFSVFWFMSVQAIQLSWLASAQYMGPLIFVVYAILIFLIGLQFGCLVFFFGRRVMDKEEGVGKSAEKASVSDYGSVTLLDCFAMAGCWVLLEWVRIFFFTGFTWNPVGLALADSSYAIQFASILGVYGLSFWVIFVNCFSIYVLQGLRVSRKTNMKLFSVFNIRRIAIWLVIASLPYLYGIGQMVWVKKYIPFEKSYNIALVQTAILPEQKDYYVHRSTEFIPPLNQWERVWSHLDPKRSLDLIVLPEAAVSMSAYRLFYPIEFVKAVWERHFGEDSLAYLPPLESPLAQLGDYRGEKVWKVSNAYIAQALSNFFRATVITGFDDQQGEGKYNSAFCFKPKGQRVERYKKRILVPVGEYVPFAKIRWVAEFLKGQFGIGDSFDVGHEANPFTSPVPIGVSICLEETYSHLIRDLRLNGARLFVNVTNDVWFPRSRLPEHHFQHGRIRAAENGVYLLRACNTGITGAIDCCGQIVKTLPPSEEKIGVLYLTNPLRSFDTLYTWWGDSAILLCSGLFVFLSILVRFLKKLQT